MVRILLIMFYVKKGEKMKRVIRVFTSVIAIVALASTLCFAGAVNHDAGVYSEYKTKALTVTGDGYRMTFTYDEIMNETYQNEKGGKGLVPIIAYGVNDAPMVTQKSSAGYSENSKNDGGPLRLVVGQEFNQEINSSKFVKDVVKIEITGKGEQDDFGDVGEGYAWAEDSIYSLYDRGVISGLDEKAFAPDKNVKRSEYAKMVTLALSLKIPEVKAITFTDVPDNYWAAPYIQAVSANLRMKGVSETEFNPDGILRAKNGGSSQKQQILISFRTDF